VCGETRSHGSEGGRAQQCARPTRPSEVSCRAAAATQSFSRSSRSSVDGRNALASGSGGRHRSNQDASDRYCIHDERKSDRTEIRMPPLLNLASLLRTRSLFQQSVRAREGRPDRGLLDPRGGAELSGRPSTGCVRSAGRRSGPTSGEPRDPSPHRSGGAWAGYRGSRFAALPREERGGEGSTPCAGGVDRIALQLPGECREGLRGRVVRRPAEPDLDHASEGSQHDSRVPDRVRSRRGVPYADAPGAAGSRVCRDGAGRRARGARAGPDPRGGRAWADDHPGERAPSRPGADGDRSAGARQDQLKRRQLADELFAVRGG
jgi:hypothetical protein